MRVCYLYVTYSLEPGDMVKLVLSTDLYNQYDHYTKFPSGTVLTFLYSKQQFSNERKEKYLATFWLIESQVFELCVKHTHKHLFEKINL